MPASPIAAELEAGLQEWSACCRALVDGRLILTARKGGIHEPHRGMFTLEHDRFALLPTREHQRPDRLRPGLSDDESTPDGRIHVAGWCQAVAIWRVGDLARLHAVADELPWTEAELAARFAYRGNPFLFVLALRAWRLPAALDLADDPAYAGCRSWIRLREPVATAGSRPALADDAFAARLARVAAALGGDVVSGASAILLVSCRDRTGLVAALSDFVFRNDGNILDLDQHAEHESGMFSMRLAWSLERFRLDRPGIAAAISGLADSFGLQWELSFDDVRPRVAVLVSRTPHCLYDLLLRQRLGELRGDILLVLSNHEELRAVAGHFAIPFHRQSFDGGKAAAEAAQQRLLAEHGIDLVVLARYMQVLSPEFVAGWPARIINIHHSFLPAFVGARPYHQAKERGVKVIGATAHYVTSDLDQGPIIEQDVCRVSHRDEVEELVRKGRDLERQVLGRAVRLHLERRVLVSGNRTIVFG